MPIAAHVNHRNTPNARIKLQSETKQFYGMAWIAGQSLPAITSKGTEMIQMAQGNFLCGKNGWGRMREESAPSRTRT